MLLCRARDLLSKIVDRPDSGARKKRFIPRSLGISCLCSLKALS